MLEFNTSVMLSARLLRISILQPLKGKLVTIIQLRRYEANLQEDLSTIETRLDAVEGKKYIFDPSSYRLY